MNGFNKNFLLKQNKGSFIPSVTLNENESLHKTNGTLNILGSYPIIKKAIMKMKDRTIYRKKPTFMNTTHLTFLNDLSYFPKNTRYIQLSDYLTKDLFPYKNFMKKYKRIETIVKSLFYIMIYYPLMAFFTFLGAITFHKSRICIFLLEGFKFLIYSYFCFEFSFELASDFDTRGKYGLYLKALICCILLFDTLTNTGMSQEKGSLKKDKIIDIVINIHNDYKILLFKVLSLSSVFLYFFLSKSIVSRVLNVLVIFSITDLKKFYNLLAALLKTRGRMLIITDCLDIFLRLYIFFHLLCCLGFIIGFFPETPSSTISYFQNIILTFRLLFIPLISNSDIFNELKHFLMLLLWIFLIIYLFLDFVNTILKRSSTLGQEMDSLDKYFRMNEFPFAEQFELRQYFQKHADMTKNEDLSKAMEIINSLNEPIKKK